MAVETTRPGAESHGGSITTGRLVSGGDASLTIVQVHPGLPGDRGGLPPLGRPYSSLVQPFDQGGVPQRVPRERGGGERRPGDLGQDHLL